MATKAQQFKAETQRAAQLSKPRARKTGGPRRGPPKDDVPNPTAHNESSRAAKNALYEIEVSAGDRPPRKSTRRSPTHVKTDSALRVAAMIRNASPQARSARPGGNPN